MGFSPAELDGLALEDVPDAVRERPASVGGFFLDRFEVTAQRFVQFVREYRGAPAPGAGAHPRLGVGSGWDPEWNVELPATQRRLADLVQCGGTPKIQASGAEPDSSAGAGNDAGAELADAGEPSARLSVWVVDGAEALPMNCLSWFVASAFCIWDGGRLPTDAEWEFAAAGGDDNRVYPWGADPSARPSASFDDTARVDAAPQRHGRFGHEGLAGGLLEWVLDWYSVPSVGPSPPCWDCAQLQPALGRSVRGGTDGACCTGGFDSEFRASSRNLLAPGRFVAQLGARCARDPILPAEAGR